jgi:serpin B
MVLANALYLKARWANEFSATETKSEPFHVRGEAPAEVAMMQQTESFRYGKKNGYRVIALPYRGGDLQFVILLPDAVDGLAHLEKRLTPRILNSCAKLRYAEIDLRLPKFRFEPATIPLVETLQALGMKTAFDIPKGTADFDRMSPRRPDHYLAISHVFHKTFIALDEEGTEAAATTALPATIYSVGVIGKPKPVMVKVDRPFLYAIQHVPSGACLFIGRVTDPR